MRDATIDRKAVRLPNACTLGYGKYRAQYGDLVTFKEHYTDSTYGTRIGRVAGRIVYAPAIVDPRYPARRPSRITCM